MADTAPVSGGERSTYAVHGRFLLPDLTVDGVAGVRAGGRRTVRTHYFDTEDLRLARNGIALQRCGGAEEGWRLDLPGVLGGPVEAPDGTGETPPAAFADLVTAYTRGARLRGCAALRTSREPFHLLDPAGAEVGALTDDEVSVLAGRRVAARFRRLSLLVAGLAPEATTELTGRLEHAGAVAGSGAGELTLVFGAAAGAPPDVVPPPPLRRRDPAVALVAAALADAVGRLLRADVGVRRGLPDAVHQMRVACRRLRSDLRTFRPLLDGEWADGLRAELGWLAESLGAARDLEVLRARLAAAVETDPLEPSGLGALERIDGTLAAREVSALAAVGRALHDARYLRLLEALVAAAREPATTAAAEADCATLLPPLVAVAWTALADRAGRLRGRSPDRAFHATRILAKRVRYAAESSSLALGEPAERLARAAEDLQEVLGEHQDAVVAAAEVRAIAETTMSDDPPDGELCYTAGRLVERERTAARSARGRFPKAWRRADRPAILRWLS